MKPIIIVGAGLAGYTLAREFRKLDVSAPMLIITADEGSFYSKPMLSNALAQGKSAGQLVTQSAAQMSAQIGATILTGTRVSHIDTAGKKVETSSGTFEYSALVLAVGAQPIRLAINGDAAGEIISVNHIADYAQFRHRIDQKDSKPHITILGAGLIGCEFADDLAGAGHPVTLVDPNPRPMAALASPALSEGLHSALSMRGVNFRLSTTAMSIDRIDDVLRVSLADGSAFETDVVLSAVGLRPDLRLAQAAQLETARGIVVNAYGQTSAPDVYALGDCAEYTSVDTGRTCILPYIAPLMTAARAIAKSIAGHPTSIDLNPTPVIVKTPSFPLALLHPPVHAIAQGTWHETRKDARTVCRYYNADGIMVGFGVAPQDAVSRQGLIAELGSRKASVATT